MLKQIGIFGVLLVALAALPSFAFIKKPPPPPPGFLPPNASIQVSPSPTDTGTQVNLDGSASNDPNSPPLIPLRYFWEFVSVPAGSTAAFSNPNSSSTTFTPNLPGTYDVGLTVTDTNGYKGATDVNITVYNATALPTANAGANQTIHAVPSLVTLDGTNSSDPDSLKLAYAWSFVSRPAGSTAVLSDPTAGGPNFTADVFGNYVVQLVVTDSVGRTSQPATVTIGVHVPPVADAGTNQAITMIGSTVQLDGSQSYAPDGDTLTYKWQFSNKPLSSNAILANPTFPKSSFTADQYGEYDITLTVSDQGGSSTAKVTVTDKNLPPVANASGMPLSPVVGQTVTLDGSLSSDPDGDSLTYKWSIASAPSGSVAMISNPTAKIATFVPDVPGSYVVQLIVNDGLVDSITASTVQIQAISLMTKVTQDINNLQNAIAALDPSTFRNANMQKALLNKLNAVIGSIDAKNYSDALGQLQNDILAKTNGCASALAPSKTDWIISCTAENSVYLSLQTIIAEVKSLCGC